MNTTYQSLYAAHVAAGPVALGGGAGGGETCRRCWCTRASPMHSFLDDYEYAFRPNPHFLHWLPLTRHADSALLIVAGRAAAALLLPAGRLLVPAAGRSRVLVGGSLRHRGRARRGRLARGAGAQCWQRRPSALGEMAAIGDAPSLDAQFPEPALNPQGLVDRLHIARTRKTAYEVACIDRAARLAARAHVAAEQAFRAGESEFGIHLAYLAACRAHRYASCLTTTSWR